MPAFPTVKYSWQDLSEQTDSVVQTEPMERGRPKRRRIHSDARTELQLTVFFDTKAEAAAFLDWFNTDINVGQADFDFTHPRTGAVVLANVVGGQLGPLTFSQRTLEASQRTLRIEFWLPAI